MHPNTPKMDGATRSRASILVATLFAISLAGCAADPGGRAISPAAESSPVVGVFTGEYVDGKPLFRLPPILVIGSRLGSSLD